MILSQNDVGIVFFLGFVKAMQYFSKLGNICYGAQFFLIYDPKKGISHPLCNFRHKKYPSSNLD
jgi:hypothetical protein